MSRWAGFSYESDEVMDRVGDIWRQVFDHLPAEFIAQTLEDFFKRQSNDQAFALWKMCTIELPNDKIRRLGFLLAGDPHVGKDFIERIDHRAFDRALLECTSSVRDKVIAAGVVSYFARELAYAVPSDLRQEAIEQFNMQMSLTNDPQERSCLTTELLSLQPSHKE